MRSLAQEASPFGTVACWMFIAGTTTLICYYLGVPLTIIGLVFLGMALKKISVLAQDAKVFGNYIWGCALFWIPLLGFEMKMASLTRAGKLLGIDDFGRAVSWWRISYYLALLGILLPICVLMPLSAVPLGADADPFLTISRFAILCILFLAFLAYLGITIYSSVITLMAFKKLETQNLDCDLGRTNATV